MVDGEASIRRSYIAYNEIPSRQLRRSEHELAEITNFASEGKANLIAQTFTGKLKDAAKGKVFIIHLWFARIILTFTFRETFQSAFSILHQHLKCIDGQFSCGVWREENPAHLAVIFQFSDANSQSSSKPFFLCSQGKFKTSINSMPFEAETVLIIKFVCKHRSSSILCNVDANQSYSFHWGLLCWWEKPRNQCSGVCGWWREICNTLTLDIFSHPKLFAQFAEIKRKMPFFSKAIRCWEWSDGWEDRRKERNH